MYNNKEEFVESVVKPCLEPPGESMEDDCGQADFYENKIGT